MEKYLVILEKSEKIFFWSASMEKENNFQDLIF